MLIIDYCSPELSKKLYLTLSRYHREVECKTEQKLRVKHPRFQGKSLLAIIPVW